MATRKTVDFTPAGGALTHSPFAALGRKSGGVSAPIPEKTAPAVIREQTAPRPRAVRLRQESKGRSGKVVTRITGLPLHNLEAIAARLQQALGCGSVVEGDDLLLLGSLAERGQRWLDAAGDLREIKEQRTAHYAPRPEPSSPAEAESVGEAGSGTRRNDVRRGQRVAIVLKADQASGALTEGVVRDILTSSPTHPRGIKVRLETGEVGRVKHVRT